MAATEGVFQTFYIAPDGQDDWPGTQAKPFGSIQKAQERIRTISDEMAADILVYLRGGTYSLSQTVSFHAGDSGKNGHNVIYRNHPGEVPVLSGGRRVTHWTRVKGTDNQDLWRAHVPDIDNTRQLYVNGVKAQRTRGPVAPSGGWQVVDDPDLEFYEQVETFRGYAGTALAKNHGYPEAIPVYSGYKGTGRYLEMLHWRNHRDIEFVYDVGWTHTIIPVEEIAAADDGVIIKMRMPSFRDAQIKGGVRIQDPSYIENAFELLKNPGEWYLDRSERTLYYIPRDGEDMETAEVILPVVETLLSLQGNLDHPIHNLRFEGLTFAYSTWLRPSRTGHVEVQANLVKNPDNDANPHGAYLKSPSSIILNAAQMITFERCRFTKFGSGGIDIENGSRDNTLRGNVFSEIAGSGVQIGGFELADAHPSDGRAIVKDNLITNNVFRDIGVEYKGCTGIIIGYTDGTIISHNDISRVAYSGISVGWGWGFWDLGGDHRKPDNYPRFDRPTVARNNVVEQNHIHQVMQALHDGAGIYTLSMQPNSFIRGNLIHDNGRGDQGWPGGIYLDEASGGFTVTGNIVFNVQKAYHYHDQGIEGRQESNHVEGNFFDVKPGDPDYPDELAAQAGVESAFRDLLAIDRTT